MWLDIEQNTDEWLLARAGKITGSAIAKIMANDGKAFGEPAKKLAVDLAIQTITGKPSTESFTNAHMLRGHEQEPIARQLYEDYYFCDVSNGGFFDNGLTGCSPDGIIENGIIEIKSVIASQQYKTIKKGEFDSAYKWQVIFNLKESGKDFIDYVSFCAEFPTDKQLFVKRYYLESFTSDIEKIINRVGEFEILMNSVIDDINNLGEL